MDALTWNKLVVSLKNPHLLQSYQWSEVKASVGWKPIFRVWYEQQRIVAAALVLLRIIPVRGISSRLGVMYVPKGPLLSDWEDSALRIRVFDDLKSLAKKHGAIFIKIDPDIRMGWGDSESEAMETDSLGEEVTAELSVNGWIYSDEQVQFRNTVLIDLTPAEEEILARMKQKTRYNIRLAERKGITIRLGTREDVSMLYRMYAETAVRDGFVIRDESYYRKTWEAFLEFPDTPASIENSRVQADQDHPVAEALIAEFEDAPVAGLLQFRFGGKAWYLYGMSRDLHREKMPNHLLQWEAIRRAKSAGCRIYDLWGAPEVFDRSDSLAGVYRFKAGLGGQYTRYIGAWDYPVRRFIYLLYTHILPNILDVMRRLARSRIQKSSIHLEVS